MKNKFLLSILIFLFVFIAADLVFGNILNQKHPNFFRIRHNYYHHGLLESEAGIGTWAGYRYPFYTNNFGFRDTAKHKIRVDIKKRQVLLLGDSHTEGVGISYQACFPVILDSYDRNIQVYNASAVSYSPKLHYLRFKYLLEHSGFIPNDLVIMIDMSDVQNEIIYEKYQPDTRAMALFRQNAYEFLHRNSFVFYTIKSLISNMQLKRFSKESELFKKYMENIQFRQTFSLYVDFFDNFNDRVLVSDPEFHNVGNWMYDNNYEELYNRGLKLGAANIRKIKELTDSLGINLHLSVHPWRMQIDMGDTTDTYVNFWRETCENMEIHFINLYPAFIYPKVSITMGGGFFIPNDNHWNKHGHRVVAMELLRQLGITEGSGGM